MPRLNAIASVVFLSAALVLSSGRSTPMIAQALSSPSAQGKGVNSELLGAGPLAALPGQELMLRRVTIEPGGGLPAHTHPGSLVIYTESGSWAYTPLAGTGWLTRAAVADTTSTVPAPLIANSALDYGRDHDAPGLTEELTMGRERVLSVGDVLVVENSGGAYVNAGAEPVLLLIAGVTPSDEPFTTLETDMAGKDVATPEP